MARVPSVETQLRQAKRDIAIYRKDLETSARACSEYRARPTKAEQEVAEWKKRFDALLARTPPSEGAEHG